MQYSNIAKKQLGSNGADRPEVSDAYGRVRMICVDTTISAADTKVCLWHFPAGRVRVLFAKLEAKLATPATTLSVEAGPYTNMHGMLIPPTPGLFQAAVASAALTELSKTNPSGLVFETTSGFDMIVTASANMAVGDTIKGIVHFVID